MKEQNELQTSETQNQVTAPVKKPSLKKQFLFCATAVIIIGMFVFSHRSKEIRSISNPKIVDSAYAHFSSSDGSHIVQDHFYYKLDTGGGTPLYLMEFKEPISDSIVKISLDSHAVVKTATGLKDTIYKKTIDSAMPRFKRTLVPVSENQFVEFGKK